MTGTAPQVDPWVDLLTGRSLGPYKLTKYINDGTFAHVFEARHESTDALFALKVLKQSATPDAMSDFSNEADLLQQLNACDGVIKYVDHGNSVVTVDSAGLSIPFTIHYIVLSWASAAVSELIEDPVLRARLNATEKFRIWRDVIKAVRQMHGAGVAHRDLKCSNCLVLVRRDYSTAVVADLGRAKNLALPPAIPSDRYFRGRGDLFHSPPEFVYLQGEPGPADAIAADYYSLGSVLVEMITGFSITALAIPDIQTVFKQAQLDLMAGRRRDTGVLAGRYRAVIAAVVEGLPKSVRADASMLINQLCHPVSTMRSTPSPFRRDRRDRDNLHWILKRVDIMIKQLEIEDRSARRAEEKERRSA